MKTYYVRSTGEIIGPNVGMALGAKNRKRRAYGNLFDSQKKAERRAKWIKFILRFSGGIK